MPVEDEIIMPAAALGGGGTTTSPTNGAGGSTAKPVAASVTANAGIAMRTELNASAMIRCATVPRLSPGEDDEAVMRG
jgi:hypothetical protein